MNKTIEVTIEQTEDSLALKAVLSKSVGLSRREISRLKFTNGILLNGENCRITEIVHTGDIVTLTFTEKDLPAGSKRGFLRYFYQLQRTG